MFITFLVILRLPKYRIGHVEILFNQIFICSTFTSNYPISNSFVRPAYLLNSRSYLSFSILHRVRAPSVRSFHLDLDRSQRPPPFNLSVSNIFSFFFCASSTGMHSLVRVRSRDHGLKAGQRTTVSTESGTYRQEEQSRKGILPSRERSTLPTTSFFFFNRLYSSWLYLVSLLFF